MFVAVGVVLNVTRASERLHITQSGVSQAIRRMEHRAGVQLLMRKKYGVELTRAGRLLLTRAEDILRLSDQVLAGIRDLQHQPTGHFKIGEHPSVACYTLPLFLAPFLRKYPKIDLTLVHESSHKVHSMVLSNELDFGLVINARPNNELVMRSLCKDFYSFWVHPKCKNMQTVALSSAAPNAAKLVARVAARRAFHQFIYCGSHEVIVEMAASGACVGVLPERVAKGRGLVLWDSSLFISDSLSLCYIKERQTTAGAIAVRDALKSLDAKLAQGSECEVLPKRLLNPKGTLRGLGVRGVGPS